MHLGLRTDRVAAIIVEMQQPGINKSGRAEEGWWPEDQDEQEEGETCAPSPAPSPKPACQTDTQVHLEICTVEPQQAQSMLLIGPFQSHAKARGHQHLDHIRKALTTRGAPPPEPIQTINRGGGRRYYVIFRFDSDRALFAAKKVKVPPCPNKGCKALSNIEVGTWQDIPYLPAANCGLLPNSFNSNTTLAIINAEQHKPVCIAKGAYRNER